MRVRIALLGLLIWTGAASVQAATYTVYADGSGQFPNIQAALNYASPGDIIQLGDGIYVGTGNRNLDFGSMGTTKDLTLRSISNNPQACVIDCQGRMQGHPIAERAFYFHTAETNASLIQGIRIYDGLGTGTL